MKKIMLAVALVPLFAVSAVCRYCSGTKFRTIETTCESCRGTGVLKANGVDYSCAYCDRVKGLRGSAARGSVVPSSGKVRRRVPCDKCSPVKEVCITPAQLDTLVAEGVIILGGVKIVVRGKK